MGNGSTAMTNRRGAVLVAESGAHEQSLVAPGEPAVGGGVIGLERKGPLEKRDGIGCILGHRYVHVRKRA